MHLCSELRGAVLDALNAKHRLVALVLADVSRYKESLRVRRHFPVPCLCLSSIVFSPYCICCSCSACRVVANGPMTCCAGRSIHSRTIRPDSFSPTEDAVELNFRWVFLQKPGVAFSRDRNLTEVRSLACDCGSTATLPCRRLLSHRCALPRARAD